MTLLLMSLAFFGCFISYKYSKNNRVSLLISAMLFTSGLAALANELQDKILPLAEKVWTISEYTKDKINLTNAFITQLSEHSIALIFYVFCINYSSLCNSKKYRLLTAIVIVFAVITFISFPIMTNQEKIKFGIYKNYYTVLSLWSVPLIIYSCFTALWSFFKENDLKIKSQKGLELLFIIPLSVSCIVNLYILRAIGMRLTWKVNGYLTIVEIIIFLLLLFKYQLFGIKLFKKADK